MSEVSDGITRSPLQQSISRYPQQADADTIIRATHQYLQAVWGCRLSRLAESRRRSGKTDAKNAPTNRSRGRRLTHQCGALDWIVKMPGWRNRQTRKLEVLVSIFGRAGSTPVPGSWIARTPLRLWEEPLTNLETGWPNRPSRATRSVATRSHGHNP